MLLLEADEQWRWFGCGPQLSEVNIDGQRGEMSVVLRGGGERTLQPV